MSGEREREVDRWLRFARRDLRGAGAQELDPALRCYLAQQAGEKAIKAVLIFSEIDFPYSHDLDLLRELVPVGYPFPNEFPKLSELTNWMTAGRYPGEYEEATSADAASAVDLASRLVEAVVRDLATRRTGEA